MRILHTADWHLGRALYGKKRYAEFEAFLNWLADAITKHAVDVLLIAGDVFDTSTPSNRAQSLYYDFLHRVAKGNCRHIVIIGGNHDSPSFLNAPKALLHALNVHVVGAMPDDLSEEVITLYHYNNPEAIICAVPYLRDKDIRLLEAGENIDDKNAKLIEGIRNHYAEVCTIAEAKQTEYENTGFKDIPIIGMGHLFTAGAQTVDGDGVRELYVGTLAHIGRDLFPQAMDYLALGHLHVPQKVGSAEHIRYSGSPIPMGYGEINQDKQVLLVDFVGRSLTVTPLLVPRFQQLVKMIGDVQNIQQKIEQLKAEQSNAWLEIEYTGTEIVSNLRDLLDETLSNSELEVLRIKNRRLMERVIHSEMDEETLDDLNPDDVFVRCLTAFEVDEAEQTELIEAYQEIIQELQDSDKNAE